MLSIISPLLIAASLRAYAAASHYAARRCRAYHISRPYHARTVRAASLHREHALPHLSDMEILRRELELISRRGREHASPITITTDYFPASLSTTPYYSASCSFMPRYYYVAAMRRG